MKATGVEWKEAKLGDILRYLDERVTMDDEKEYLTITVRRRHGGLEIREKLFGHQIATKKQFALIPGAFIISRVQCWHQAYAIVGDVPTNTIASQNYDQFAISPKVDARFFWWLSHSPAFTETIRSSAVGVVIEKMVFNREEWLTKTVRLPPLAEQRRVVARIEELAAQIHEASILRHQAAEEAGALLTAARRAVVLESRAEIVALEDACAAIIDNLHSNPRLSETGVPCVRSPDVGYGTLDLDGAQRTDEDEFCRRTVRGEPKADDIVLVREGGGTGKCAVVLPGQRFSLGQRVMMLRPNTKRILPRFFLHQLLSPQIQEDQIAPLSKGSASPHLNIGALRRFNIVLPPLPEQRRIVSELDALQAEVDALKRLQAETAAELDALLPTILDRAFKGEL